MAGETDLHRDIGVLQGRMGALEQQVRDNQTRNEARMADLSAAMRDIAKQVGEVHDAVTSAKGGARTLIATGSFGAALGGLLIAALEYLRHFGIGH